MSWNYRIVKETDDYGNEYMGVREVYYNTDGSIRVMTEGLARIGGETVDEIRESCQKILECLDKPILVDGEIVFVDPDEVAKAAGREES